MSFTHPNHEKGTSGSQVIQLTHVERDAQVVAAKVARVARRIVTCDNPRMTPQEEMAEALWEEWYNEQDDSVASSAVYH